MKIRNYVISDIRGKDVSYTAWCVLDNVVICVLILCPLRYPLVGLVLNRCLQKEYFVQRRLHC